MKDARNKDDDIHQHRFRWKHFREYLGQIENTNA